VNPYFKLTVLVAATALCACTVLDGEKVDYKSSAKAPSLMVPPDLTQLSKDTRYSTVNGGVSAAASKTLVGQSTVGQTVAVASIADIKIERQGNQRWLVVNRSAENLWGPLKDFWAENGFTLSMDQSGLGIMETEWNENRANIPQDIIRSSLGKWLDSLYSTSLRDKYRTRLETRSDGGTEIFITHRGVEEVYVSGQKDRTIWQPRPVDPELEAEFLRRLMVKLGAGKAQAAQVPAQLNLGMVLIVVPDNSSESAVKALGERAAEVARLEEEYAKYLDNLKDKQSQRLAEQTLLVR
jgi:outer membrane protein assembly factor BamC